MKNYKDHIGLLVFMTFSVAFAIGFSKLAEDKSDKPLQGIPHNYWHPSWTGETLLDTMKAIIPKGKGTIEYEDGTHDSIRWGYPEDDVTRGVSIDPIQSDEYRMWITGEGDTIWE